LDEVRIRKKGIPGQGEIASKWGGIKGGILAIYESLGPGIPKPEEREAVGFPWVRSDIGLARFWHI
jgi:hypothetical protein